LWDANPRDDVTAISSFSPIGARMTSHCARKRAACDDPVALLQLCNLDVNRYKQASRSFVLCVVVTSLLSLNSFVFLIRWMEEQLVGGRAVRSEHQQLKKVMHNTLVVKIRLVN